MKKLNIFTYIYTIVIVLSLLLVGNISAFAAVPSGCSVQISSNATYTNSTSTTLTLAATGATTMNISNTAFGTGTDEAYNTNKIWTLTAGDGTKTVYVRFKNASGNTDVTDNIVYDGTAPGA
ncbi:MAG TPA: hypothetical protein DHV24_02910, partial [Candidatus Margulisbacteria bacterium]|nr:hypothetical protein [Candidatus Margulisiibacteriota bacterium]